MTQDAALVVVSNKLRILEDDLCKTLFRHVQGFSKPRFAQSADGLRVYLRYSSVKAVLLRAEVHSVVRQATLELLSQYPDVVIFVQDAERHLNRLDRSSGELERLS